MRSILMFITGAAVGAFIAWDYTKRKYEELLEEAKTATDDLKNEQDVLAKKEEYYESRKNTMVSYESALSRLGYLKEHEEPIADEEKKPVEDYSIFVIAEEEFDTQEDFEIKSLFYNVDTDTLVDADTKIEIEDAESIIGDALNEFLTLDDIDSVYVRNEPLQTDYEILLTDSPLV